MEITQHIASKIRGLLVGFTLLISVFFVLLLLSYSWLVEDNVFNRLVAEEARYIQQTFVQQQHIPSPRVPFMKLYRSWNELPENIQLLRAQSPDRIEYPLESGGTLHLTLLTLGQSQWILAADVSGYEVSKDYLPKILPWIIGALLGIGLISYSISRYLANHIVKPIQHISDGLQHQQENAGVLFEYDFAANEIGYLAASVASSFNRLKQSLERESQFTRDISHELRTPTAVLKMIAEKLDSDGGLSPSSAQRLQQAVLQIEHTLNVLLALAREESVHTEMINLKQALEHCIVNHLVLANDTNAQLELDLDARLNIMANQNLLHILINNLLDNAVHHGAEIRLHIQAKDRTLRLTNPVKPSEFPGGDPLSPEVKSMGSKGLGLGLHLVKRICDRMSWQLDVCHEQGNFTVLIQFDDGQNQTLAK